MRQRQEPVFYDRYERRLVPEEIYGESALRWTCETRLGRLALEAAVKRRWFSGLYGFWADRARSAREIGPFIERFGLDPAEFADPADSFRTFNEFFYRKLTPEARPVDEGDGVACFPADGRHLLVPDLSRETFLYAKGRRFDLAGLLGDEELAGRYARGSAVLSRLCPTDCHRFHFPLAGIPGAPRLLDGVLYSVNPIQLARNVAALWRNKRQITEVRDSPVGEYLFLEVGATNVGGIVVTAEAGSPVSTGDEKGYFRFGGSMVITIFPEGSFLPADDLAEQSREGIELYARLGDRMGEVKDHFLSDNATALQPGSETPE